MFLMKVISFQFVFCSAASCRDESLRTLFYLQNFFTDEKDDLSPQCHRFYVWNLSSFVSVSSPISFFLVLSASLPPPPTHSLALHLYPPCCHTFSPSLLTLPFLVLLHSPLIFSMAFLGASFLSPPPPPQMRRSTSDGSSG